MRADTQIQIQSELRFDRSYQSLTARMMTLANQRARLADVMGIERVLRAIHERDAELGEQRPEAVHALVSAVEARLDAARRLQLARDRFALREPELTEYRVAMVAPMDLFARLKPALEAQAPGLPPAAWRPCSAPSRRFQLVSSIAPPEVAAAHCSSARCSWRATPRRFARSRAGERHDARLGRLVCRGGALMLGAKARTDAAQCVANSGDHPAPHAAGPRPGSAHLSPGDCGPVRARRARAAPRTSPPHPAPP